MIFNAKTDKVQRQTSLLVLAGMIGVIAAVLAFQHIGGYIPCKLCLGQREPYYAAIPVAFLATLSAWLKWPACLARGALAIVGLLMVYAAILGAQHSGVEWGWWPGPTDCGAVAEGITTNAGDLFGQLATTRPPSCNEAAGRFLGLSFAGWNVVVSVILAGIAFRGVAHIARK
jgi:disulfide bond formation protein DsbB